MPPRQRLTPDQRRAELLDVGERVFSQGTFETVSMDDVAAEAGVTRRLLYHYFPTKAEFFGAIWQRAHTRLRQEAGTGPGATVRDGLDDALAAYFDFYEAHLPLVVVANRSSVAASPEVRGPVAANFALLCAKFLDAAGAQGRERELATIGFQGWIALVREVAVASFVDGRLTREECHRMCMDVLDATVGVHADLLRVPNEE